MQPTRLSVTDALIRKYLKQLSTVDVLEKGLQGAHDSHVNMSIGPASLRDSDSLKRMEQYVRFMGGELHIAKLNAAVTRRKLVESYRLAELNIKSDKVVAKTETVDLTAPTASESPVPSARDRKLEKTLKSESLVRKMVAQEAAKGAASEEPAKEAPVKVNKVKTISQVVFDESEAEPSGFRPPPPKLIPVTTVTQQTTPTIYRPIPLTPVPDMRFVSPGLPYACSTVNLTTTPQVSNSTWTAQPLYYTPFQEAQAQVTILSQPPQSTAIVQDVQAIITPVTTAAVADPPAYTAPKRATVSVKPSVAKKKKTGTHEPPATTVDTNEVAEVLFSGQGRSPTDQEVGHPPWENPNTPEETVARTSLLAHALENSN